MHGRTPFLRPLVPLAATAALLLAGPARADASCPHAAMSPAVLTSEQAAAAVVCQINLTRSAHGVRTLRGRRALERAAGAHSSDMVERTFFSHFSPNGDSPLNRARAAGYMSGARVWGVGENLRFGAGAEGSPAAAVHAWMNSPSHRQTLLRTRWRHVGVGVRHGSPSDQSNPNSATYTVDFGFRRG